MPKRELPILAIKRGVYTPVEVGIHITNNTPENLHFCFFSSLFPEVIAPDGQFLQLSASADQIRSPEQSNFMQVMKVQAVTFYFKSGFFGGLIPKKARSQADSWD